MSVEIERVLGRCENTKAAEGQIKNLVYTLELASKRADASGKPSISSSTCTC